MPVIHVKFRGGQILAVKGEESMVSFLGFGFSLFHGGSGDSVAGPFLLVTFRLMCQPTMPTYHCLWLLKSRIVCICGGV